MTKQRWTLTVTALALTVNLIIGSSVHSNETEASGEKELYEKISVMMRVLHLIRQDYVDEEKTAPDKLIYNSLRGMVGSLDPFSSFMSPEEYQKMMESPEAHFGGFGIIVTVEEGYLTVITPIDGSPGQKAGILPGDRILKIDKKDVVGVNMDNAVDLLKGPVGDSAELTLQREGSEELITINLKRAEIELPTVKYVQKLSDDIGYIKITQFSEPTAEKVEEALKQLEKKNVRGLIIDVRNNPGGLLESAVRICERFLPENKLVVSTEGRRPSQINKYYTGSGYKFPEIPIAVLTNKGSASASEILAGCLKDWKRAILIGEKSFGKGSVQNVLALPDGSALRLTTAMYYTPGKRRIHGNGLEPDIATELPEEELEKIYKNDEINLGKSPEDQSVFPDSQLKRALEVLKGYDSLMEAKKDRYKTLPETSDKPTEKE